MHTPRRVFFVVLAVALLALSLAASGAHAARAQPAALSGTLTIFDHTSLSNPEGKALIRAYEGMHPGVHIKVVPLPPGDPVPLMNAQLAGGTAADVLTLNTVEQPWKDLHKGWYLDLTSYAKAPDPYVPGNKHWMDLIDPRALGQIRFIDGHFYTLTTTGFDVGFVYNKAIFAKLGLTVPRTWTQLLKALQRAKAAGYIPLATQLGDTSYNSDIEGMITILEDMVMAPTLKRMDANHDGVVDIHEFVRAVKSGVFSTRNADFQESWTLMKQLAPYFQLGAIGATSSDQGFNLFKTGRVAMWFIGSYIAPQLDTTPLKWGAFYMPQVTTANSRFATPGEKAVGANGACCGQPWAIPATTKKRGHLALAIDFLYYLSAPRNTNAFAAANGLLNIERSGAQPAEIAPFIYAANHVSPLAVAELTMPPDFLTTRNRLVGEYVTGSLSLTQAMHQMQAEMDRDAAQAVTAFGLAP
jgi:ABC-type glycerol-3-phosphate transport system substrate-binding protein